MPVVLPSINKKSFHWSACLYASRLFLGTISLHLDLLMSSKTFNTLKEGYTTVDSQYGGTTASLDICVILVQFSNAETPIVLTLFPIFTFCRLVHFLKAYHPIVVTLFGMVTEVRELQFEYLQPIITQYFIDNKSEIWLLFLIAHSKR